MGKVNICRLACIVELQEEIFIPTCSCNSSFDIMRQATFRCPIIPLEVVVSIDMVTSFRSSHDIRVIK